MTAKIVTPEERSDVRSALAISSSRRSEATSGAYTSVRKIDELEGFESVELINIVLAHYRSRIGVRDDGIGVRDAC